MKGMWVGYDVGCTMGLTCGHGAWQIDRQSSGSMWNSYSFQPVGQWMSYSFTDLGAEGCCRSLNALLRLSTNFLHSNKKWNSSSTTLHTGQSLSCGGIIGQSQRPVSTLKSVATTDQPYVSRDVCCSWHKASALSVTLAIGSHSLKQSPVLYFRVRCASIVAASDEIYFEIKRFCLLIF